MHNSDEENEYFVLVPAYIMFSTLQEWGVLKPDAAYNSKIFSGIVDDFMERMTKSGYVVVKDGD